VIDGAAEVVDRFHGFVLVAPDHRGHVVAE
jgi:hypothetical protein